MNAKLRFWHVAIVSALLLGLTGVAVAQGPGPQDQPTAKFESAAGPQLAQTLLGTAITYQGQLLQASVPVTGTCDFQFGLWDAAGSGSPPTGGAQIGATQTKMGVSVTRGQFTIPDLDFGGGAFTGDARWLQIAVKCGGEANYTTLAPRQALTPAPYALYAPDSGSTTALRGKPLAAATPAANQVLKWDGSKWLPAVDETGGGTGSFWSLTGNAGTNPTTHFLGTTDNVTLTLTVSNTPALRLVPNATSPNIIGGYRSNSVMANVAGATIGGGGSKTGCGLNNLSPCSNSVTADYGSVNGGRANTVNGIGAFVGGGGWNEASGDYAVVAGGGGKGSSFPFTELGNIASGDWSTISGGYGNICSGSAASVGGGVNNTASGTDSIVSGGANNTASGLYNTVGGGLQNTASASNFPCGVGYCYGNATVAGGRNNTASGMYATVSGGQSNRADGSHATIGGGEHISVTGQVATVAGGSWITATGDYAFVGGGRSNVVTTPYATISGGGFNEATGFGAVVGGGGGYYQQFGFSKIGTNTASGVWSTVGGGGSNSASGFASVVAGGGGIDCDSFDGCASRGNSASGFRSTIGGGAANYAGGAFATVSGGWANDATGQYATVGGGNGNYATAEGATVPGGSWAAATHYGQMAYASGGFFDHGDAQASLYVMRRTTTSERAWENLYLDGSGALLTLANDRAMTFDILIVGSGIDGESAGYRCFGVVKNVGGTISFVGRSCSDEYENDIAWDVTLVVDSVNDALLVQVMGNGESIRWVASVRTVETEW